MLYTTIKRELKTQKSGIAFPPYLFNIQVPWGQRNQGRQECLAFNGWIKCNEKRISLAPAALWVTLFSNSFLSGTFPLARVFYNISAITSGNMMGKKCTL